nr:FUSC family protein [Bittarella massiliensis (ex Durand et al. 2017)]
MRMVKTAVAVFLCFAIDAFRGGGIPFYSAIAAVLCLQPSWQSSTQKARERTVATFLGGLAGMLVLAAERSWFPSIPALGWYALVAACLIPLLSLTVVLKKPGSAYLSCVVFMSVTVSHGGDENPYLFAFNRIVDTLIGILVALAVGGIRLPRRGGDCLLAADLEGQLAPGGALSPAVRVRLTRLCERGTPLAVCTALSPSVALGRLAGVPLTAPLAVLGGAVVCTQTGDDVLWSAPLTPEGERAARSLLDGVGAAGFCYFLDREGLQISYGPSLRPGEEALRRATRALPHRHYRFSPGGARGEGAVLGWLALLPEKQAEAVRQGADGEVRADGYPSGEPGERWVWLHSPAAGYGPALAEIARRLGSPASAPFWPPDGLTGERAVRALEKRVFGGR